MGLNLAEAFCGVWVWAGTVSALEAKVRTESGPVILGVLMNSLWVADQRRLELKGPGVALLQTASIGLLTINFLRRIKDIKTRERILRDAWKTSDHFGLFYRVVASEQYHALKKDRTYETIFPADILKKLRRESVAKTKEILDSENAPKDPMLIWLINYNAEAEGPDTVLNWTRSLLSNPSKLAGVLTNIIRVSRRGEPDEKLELNYGVLIRYFTVDANFVEATTAMTGLSCDEVAVIQQAHAIAVNAMATNPIAAVPTVGDSPEQMVFVPDLI